MSVINITNARKDLYNLIENINHNHDYVLITSKKGNAVLLSEDDWNAIQETLHLSTIPGMTESLIKGKESSPDDCIEKDGVLFEE